MLREDGGDVLEILKVEEGLWVLGKGQGDRADEQRGGAGVPCHAVLWRRISGGTDSERGSRFVERMLTVVATCRRRPQRPGVPDLLL
ncbi:MAG: hypothetical protein U0790_17260 [Isosphaeraceae bacterium]